MSEVENPVDLTFNSFNKMQHKDVKMVIRGDKGLRIQLKNIHHKLREDGTCWNRRDMTSQKTIDNVKAIAHHIMTGGRVPQLEVQPRSGGGVELVDGYCRHAAYGIADAGGLGEMWVDIVPFVGDELAALGRIETSGKHGGLEAIEQMDLYLSIRAELKAGGSKGTLQEIADVVKVSRQRVDQVLKLAELDDEAKALVATGQVKASEAVAAVRKGAEAVEQMKAEVKKPSAPPAPSVAPTLLKDMYTILAPMRAKITADEARDVELFLKGDNETPRNSDHVKVSIADWARLTSLLAEGDRQLEAKAAKAQSKDQASRQEELADVDLD